MELPGWTPLKCQTFAFSPAAPGDFLFLVKAHQVKAQAMLDPRTTSFESYSRYSPALENKAAKHQALVNN
jgi:hypothetical protein